MKLLVLGGTRFLGRHLVETALRRGHALTLFNRGRTAPGLFAGVEEIRGEREGDLAPLRGRAWDAVVDTCGYLPRLVRHSAARLADAVGRYVFVSSISVYADAASPALDENALRARLPAADGEDIAAHYGALKAACEDEVNACFGARALLIRPGLIVGPHDPTGRFTYWVRRVARGGQVLAPPSREYPVQFIDARDLAAWIVDLVERGAGGAFNTSGPAEPLTFAAFLDECRRALAAKAQFVWPDAGFLARHGVRPWAELPLYAGEEGRGLNEVSLARALSAGLRLRPLAETCIDTLAAAEATPLVSGVGLETAREAELLQAWHAPSAAAPPSRS